MKLLLSNFVFYIIYLLLVDTVTAQDNLMIFDSLLIEIIEEEIIIPGADLGDTVIINQPSGSDNFMNYSAIVISNYLQNNGYRVYRNRSDFSSSNSTLLELAAIRVKTEYSEPYSESIVGRDYCQRKITVNLKAQMSNPASGEVFQSLDTEKIYTDEIKYNNIEELEASSYRFTEGKRQDHSGWDKFIEPALVISTVVIVILLFFTQRA